MGIVVIGTVFVDVKGYPDYAYIPAGRNAGKVERVHGGVGRNVAEDIANCELRPTFVSLVDESGDGITEAVFEIPEDAAFVRFSVFDKFEKSADTRGFFRDELGI